MILKVKDALKSFSRTDPDCSRSDAFGRSASGSPRNIPHSLSALLDLGAGICGGSNYAEAL